MRLMPRLRQASAAAGAQSVLAGGPDGQDRALRALGWAVLLLGFGGFLLWAGTAPLDQGVPVPGVVAVAGSHRLVQPVTGGIVRAIHVREGDTVRRGDVVVELDATEARAQYHVAAAQLVAGRALAARLQAELDDQAQVVYPQDMLEAARSDEDVRDAMEQQRHVLQARRAAERAQLALLGQGAAGLEAQLHGLQAVREARATQLAMLREEIASQREVAEQGYMARNRVSEQERVAAQLEGGMAEDAAAMDRARSGLGEARLRLLSHREERLRELSTQLAEVARDSAGLRSRVQALAFEVDNARIVAPADGVVVALNVHTPGGVVPAGASLVDIVPTGSPLQVEAQIPLTLIDRVRPGLPARVLFTAFNTRTTPRVDAVVRTVSADALADPGGRGAYYRAQLEVPAASLRQLGANRLQPGMPAQVYIRTGERTLLNYLFRPLLDRLHAALNED